MAFRSVPRRQVSGRRSCTKSHSKKRVAYYHPKDVGNYHYGVSEDEETKKLVRNASFQLESTLTFRKNIQCAHIDWN
jgi:hypothetical protein